jgi:alpha-beta hydrolase superfamily lysophospholipase
MGGYVVQKYLEKYHAPAAVLLASIPVSGILGFALRYGRRHPWPFLKANLVLDPWHMVATEALAQDAFFSPHLPAPELARHFARLQSESIRIEFDAMLLNLPRPQHIKAPMLVLAAENDQVFTVAEEEKTAEAYGATAVTFPSMAHDMMLEPGWQNVADHILNWLSEQGL